MSPLEREMKILSPKRSNWLKVGLSTCIGLSLLLSGCGGVSSDTLRPFWTKQVNQEVAPTMKDVFAPVSSHVTTVFQLNSNQEWDVPADKLPDYKYGLQHATGNISSSLDPSITVSVKLDQPMESYELNQLVEQIWSCKEQLKINGVTSAKVKLEYAGKVYVDAWLQSINKPGDIIPYLHMKSNG